MGFRAGVKSTPLPPWCGVHAWHSTEMQSFKEAENLSDGSQSSLQGRRCSAKEHGVHGSLD